MNMANARLGSMIRIEEVRMMNANAAKNLFKQNPHNFFSARKLNLLKFSFEEHFEMTSYSKFNAHPLCIVGITQVALTLETNLNLQD